MGSLANHKQLINFSTGWLMNDEPAHSNALFTRPVQFIEVAAFL